MCSMSKFCAYVTTKFCRLVFIYQICHLVLARAGFRIRIVLMRIRIQHFSNCGSGFRIRIPDPDPNWKKFITGNLIFIVLIKIAIYLSLGLHKGRPSYRRSLQFSKENIQHFKRWKFCPFFYFFGSFLPSWIRISNLYADPDPDPAAQINADPCGSGSGYGSETLSTR